MNGSHERGTACVIPKRVADFGDQHGQVHVRHKRLRQEPLVYLSFRDGIGPSLYEEREQIEGFWRQVHGLCVAQ